MSHPRPPHRPRPGHDSPARQDAAAPLSVWATAQTDARAQRRGRYLPAATAHPAKMLPAIAATAITRYSEPGDLVADPMCGIGTTLVEAIHLGRDAIGVEYEPRWAQLAAANITCARRHGAPGTAEVVRGDARQLPALLPAGYVRGGWRWWSPHPPTGAPSTGRSAPRSAPGAAGCTSTTTATATTPPTSHCTAPDDLLAGFTRILAGCTVLLRPGGTVVVTARPWRQHGELVDLPGADPRRRRDRRPDPGRAVRGPARRAAGPAADPAPVVLPAGQHPQGPRPRRALAPDRPRGRPGLPRPREARGFA